MVSPCVEWEKDHDLPWQSADFWKAGSLIHAQHDVVVATKGACRAEKDKQRVSTTEMERDRAVASTDDSIVESTACDDVAEAIMKNNACQKEEAAIVEPDLPKKSILQLAQDLSSSDEESNDNGKRNAKRQQRRMLRQQYSTTSQPPLLCRCIRMNHRKLLNQNVKQRLRKKLPILRVVAAVEQRL